MPTALTTRVSTDATYAPTVKGSPLSSAEIDNNFISLATNKIETSLLSTTATNNSIVQRTSTGGIDVKAITATSLTISGGGLPTSSGGTGITTYTSGQLLIGNSGGTLTAATLTGTANQITVTNSSGSITLSTPQDLAANSNVQFSSLGLGTSASGVAGEIRAINQITAYYSSDRNLKENITDIPDALEKVNHIGGKIYDWNDEYISKHGGEDGYFVQKSDFGVIAQDVQEVFPVAVRKREDGTLAVDYQKLCALAFAAIKELNIQVQQLKEQK
jgi:hypothetical protein